MITLVIIALNTWGVKPLADHVLNNKLIRRCA